MMGDFLGSFLGSVSARTKHTEKARGNLWGQSMILEVVPGNCFDLGRGRVVTVKVINNKIFSQL